MVQIQIEGSVGDRSCVPYVAGFFNCALWAVFEFSPDGSSVLVLVNIFGAVCTFNYFVRFMHFCDDERFLNLLVCPLIGALLLIGLVVFYISDIERNVLLLSWICASSKGLLVMAPLMKLGVVYRQRNMVAMPSLLASSISLLTAGLWAAFAFTGSTIDNVLFWPSIIGVLSAGLQVFLHFLLRHNVGLQMPLLA